MRCLRAVPDKTAQLEQELAALEEAGLRRRRRVLQSAQRAHVVVDGREYVAFASNDYLGLAAHPDLIAAAREGVERYGLGGGASHLILGHSEAHEGLERALAQFVGMPAAVLFSSGYMANIGIVTALASRTATVFADRLNHASLNDAVLLSRAQFKRYAHADMQALERLLAESTAPHEAHRERRGVQHGRRRGAGARACTGLPNATMRGSSSTTRMDSGSSARAAAACSTISACALRGSSTWRHSGKSAGAYGAFVAGSRALIDTLVQRARTYIYTTATPPLIAHALRTSLRAHRKRRVAAQRVFGHVARLKAGLRSCRWKLLASDTPIQPLVVGTSIDALALSRDLEARGILVPAIRPPTVPQGTARLRISLSADHTPEDVDRLVDALSEIDRSSDR